MAVARAAAGCVSAAFFLAAIALLGIAGWMIGRDPGFSGASAEATGTVVALERSSSANRSATYRPVVVFRDAGGTKRRFVSTIGSNPPDYAEGDTVAVRYDPAAPEGAVIDSWAARLLPPALTAGMGLLILWLQLGAIRSAIARRRPA